jgi:hypothetical protein
VIDAADSKTDFMRFAEYPPEARAKHIVQYLDRYQELAALGIEQLRFNGVGRSLLQRLASVVKTYDAWQIRRFDEDKRYALAACFLLGAALLKRRLTAENQGVSEATEGKS